MKAEPVLFWLGLLSFLTTACASGQTPLPGAVTDTPPPFDTATTCVQELVPPRITETQPAQAAPGSEITVIGTGGYIQDSCGGYNESSRGFALYLDQEPVGDLSCYVNRCEAKVTLPDTISTGMHCLSVQRDECQFEFQVTAQ